jgi:DNA-binding MarR family transcriptional regulator
MLQMQQRFRIFSMRKKLSPATIETWAHFVRAEQFLLEKVEADLKAADMPPLVWYDVLLELARDPDGRLRHKDLHARMLLTKYNLSRLVDRMEAEGLVRRETVDDDARGAYVAITETGRKTQKKMWPVYEEAIFAYFAGHFDETDIDQLKRLLDKLLRQ